MAGSIGSTYSIRDGNAEIEAFPGGRKSIPLTEATIERERSLKALLGLGTIKITSVSGSVQEWTNVPHVGRAYEALLRASKGQSPEYTPEEGNTKDVLKGISFLFFVLTLAALVTSPIALGMFFALSHEGIDISNYEGDSVYVIGFIFLLFAYWLVKATIEIIDGGAEEIGESVVGVLFKVISAYLIMNIIIGALVYLGYRISI